MLLKVGDKVFISGPSKELLRYDADWANGHKGIVIGTEHLAMDTLFEWAKKIPGIKPSTIMYLVQLDGSGGECMLFDFHVFLDLDKLPYDEWVRRRDWNKVYKDQENLIRRSGQ